MFYSITGQVVYTDATSVAVSCGGVAFNCSATANTLKNIGTIGDTVTLYTYLNVREGIFELYGFIDEEEKSCFLMLTSVNGVGPKAALSILSVAPPDRLALSIITGDEKMLMQAPGIGKKIAQRIILELKDKLAKEQSSFGPDTGGSVPVMVLPNDKAKEAGAALAVLGYSGSEVAAALKGIDMDALPLEEIIRQALKRMVK